MSQRSKRIGNTIATYDYEPADASTSVGQDPLHDRTQPPEPPKIAIGQNQWGRRAEEMQAKDRLRNPRYEIYTFLESRLTNKFEMQVFETVVLNIDT
jgi:hypothetical protein